MRIFALGDLHLSFGRPKPMDIFGALWKDHPRKIADAWDAAVEADDVVLLAGDLSWARSLDEARPDLEFVANRPGRLKLLLRGNHDSWCSGAGKVRRALPTGLALLHNDAVRLDEGVVLCGARGWDLPQSPWFDAVADERIYRRELNRLDLSLAAARRVERPGDEKIAVLHYPPVAPGERTSEVIERLAKASVPLAVYGHLHGEEDHAWAPRGVYGGVDLVFVAADYVGFAPQPIWESGRGLVAGDV